MNAPPVIATHACVHCGALSQSNEGRCWLCYEDKSSPNPFAVTGASLNDDANSAPTNQWESVFSVLLGLCVLMTLLIGIGLAVGDRGLLIPFAIFMAPAYAITITRGMLQKNKNNARPSSLFMTFVISLLATVSISMILMVATAILLFLMCLGSLGKW